MDLCDDTLLVVLPLLPPKASARFKLVSWRWNRLISSSPYLRSLHKCAQDSMYVAGFYHCSRAFESLQSGLIRYENSESHAHTLSFESFEEHDEKGTNYAYEVCASCNGFFLFERPSALILRNPSMETNLRIPFPPQPPPHLNSTYLTFYGLAILSWSSSTSSELQTKNFDPLYEVPYCFSGTPFHDLDPSLLCYLGQSSSEQLGNKKKIVFKIICISIGRKVETCLCSIYSSLTHSWMPLEMDGMVHQQLSSPQEAVYKRFYGVCDPYPNLNPVGATFLKQSLHWLYDDGRIFAFDLEEQTWRYMETPAARGGELRLIKNYSDIISATVKSMPYCRATLKFEAELVKKLSCYWYPNVWLGSVGEHIYLLLVIDETNLQLWILDNYDEVDWKIIVDIKNCGFIAPLFFDGRTIFVAAFNFEEWKNKRSVIRFFDIFTRQWLQTNFITADGLNQIRHFFARSPSSD